MQLPESKVVALEVERKLWICRLSSYASRHYCIKVILPCSITILIYDEANIIFWPCNSFISKLQSSFSSLFSLWGQLGRNLPRRLLGNPLTPTRPSECHSQMADFPHKCDFVNHQWIKPRDLSYETFVLKWHCKCEICWLKLLLLVWQNLSTK